MLNMEKEDIVFLQLLHNIPTTDGMPKHTNHTIFWVKTTDPPPDIQTTQYFGLKQQIRHRTYKPHNIMLSYVEF
jgi:hypothetical protein